MAARQGLTLLQIQEHFDLSRSTALRMLATLESLPGVTLDEAERIEEDHRLTKRWRISGAHLAKFATPTSAELTALGRATEALKGAGLPREVTALKSLAGKIAALVSGTSIKTTLDTEEQLRVRGLLMRPGPRLDAEADTIDKLDEALSSFRQIEFLYKSESRDRAERRTLCAFGILSGRWAYLIAFDPKHAGTAIEPGLLRTFRIDRIRSLRLLNTTYQQPESPTLAEFAQRSFGVFQEEPTDVVWRFSPQAAAEADHFLFHPTQTLEHQKDGSLVVRFRAGGLREMVQHLFTWRDDVEVIAPEALRECWEEELAVSAKALARSQRSRDRKTRP